MIPKIDVNCLMVLIDVEDDKRLLRTADPLPYIIAII